LPIPVDGLECGSMVVSEGDDIVQDLVADYWELLLMWEASETLGFEHHDAIGGGFCKL
jgi:hypothetical protein